MLVTAAVAVYDHFAYGDELPQLDTDNLTKDLFRMSTFAMSLLLAFRVNQVRLQQNRQRSFSCEYPGV